MNKAQREAVKALKKAEKEVNKAFAKRSTARDKYDELVKVPALKKAIGECYRYHNSYGSDTDKWWLYTKIVGARNDGYVTVLNIQTTCSGHQELEVRFQDYPLHDGYERIPETDFIKQWDLWQKSVNKLLGEGK